MVELVVFRVSVVVCLSITAYFLSPVHLPGWVAALIAAAVGSAIVLLELRLRRMSPARLLGGTAGAVAGLIAAALISVVLGQARESETLAFAKVGLTLAVVYLGLSLGAAKADDIGLPALRARSSDTAKSRSAMNILDTSVVIDGRIADIAETGFLDGTLAIPQFVLQELQHVADSSDSLKRNRGRRGLDVLQRLQKLPQLQVQILEEDFPQIRQVDMKLVELGKVYGCRVVTNDFNLNKVAQLHGVHVLNINDLANALKPIVLPGEIMRVFILKEGKEYNQGVAYLDDGTMVVVDNARRMISKTVDISVTSVLQTTAGKMIFGKFDERTHGIYEKSAAHERIAAGETIQS